MISYSFLQPTDKVSETQRQDIQVLLRILNSSARQLAILDIEKVSGIAFLLAAIDTEASGKIVGMATLVPTKTLLGDMGHIEEVVVSPTYQGMGIGHQLVQRLLAKARALGFSHVDLTSNPSREAANQLYQKLGFKQRETNVYRFQL